MADHMQLLGVGLEFDASEDEMEARMGELQILIDCSNLERIRNFVQHFPQVLDGHIRTPRDRWGPSRDVPVLHYAIKNSSARVVEVLMEDTSNTIRLVQAGFRLETPLMLACRIGRTEILRFLLTLEYFRGENVIDCQQPGGQTALMLACTNEDTKSARLCAGLLLERGAKVDLKSAFGMTALLMACVQGRYGLTKLLLDNRADTELRTPQRRTALMVACEEGHVDVVALLVHRGAKVDSQTPNGTSPLMMAVRSRRDGLTLVGPARGRAAVHDRDDVKIARLLLTGGATPDLQDERGLSALLMCCEDDYIALIELLLERRANINLTDRAGRTALVLACSANRLKTAQLLLKHGAGMDLQAEDGTTALMAASEYGRKELVRVLLEHGAKHEAEHGVAHEAEHGATHEAEHGAMHEAEHGAKIDLKNGNGWTALALAYSKGHIEIAQLLLERGAKIDLLANDGKTVLMRACVSGRKALIQLLLERGASVDLQNSDGTTALGLACSAPHIDAARLLLERDATIDLQDNNGTTALMLASQSAHSALAGLLLAHGAKGDMQDQHGRSAIALACSSDQYSSRQIETARLLLDHGATIDLQDSDGCTGLDLACFRGRMKAAAFLVTCGAKVDFPHIPGSQARTALTIACRNGFFEVLELLREPVCRSVVRSAGNHADNDQALGAGNPAAGADALAVAAIVNTNSVTGLDLHELSLIDTLRLSDFPEMNMRWALASTASGVLDGLVVITQIVAECQGRHELSNIIRGAISPAIDALRACSADHRLLRADLESQASVLLRESWSLISKSADGAATVHEAKGMLDVGCNAFREWLAPSQNCGGDKEPATPEIVARRCSERLRVSVENRRSLARAESAIVAAAVAVAVAANVNAAADVAATAADAKAPATTALLSAATAAEIATAALRGLDAKWLQRISKLRGRYPFTYIIVVPELRTMKTITPRTAWASLAAQFAFLQSVASLFDQKSAPERIQDVFAAATIAMQGSKLERIPKDVFEKKGGAVLLQAWILISKNVEGSATDAAERKLDASRKDFCEWLLRSLPTQKVRGRKVATTATRAVEPNSDQMAQIKRERPRSASATSSERTKKKAKN